MPVKEEKEVANDLQAVIRKTFVFLISFASQMIYTLEEILYGSKLPTGFLPKYNRFQIY